MSRFPSRALCASWLMVFPVVLSGCMYQQPMYQPGPYGQQMYGTPGGYAQPGQLVIPPSNAIPYQPGSTYDSTTPADPFKAESGSSSDKYFSGEDGGAPAPKDPGSDNTGLEKFQRDP